MRITTKAIVAIGALVFSGPLLWAQEHEHKSPHGGQVITVGSYHYEMVVKSGEIDLYVLDGKLATLPLKGMEGSLIVQLPDNTKKTVTLEPVGEYFKAPVDLGSSQNFIAIATIKIDGKSNVGRFSWSSKAKPEKEEHSQHEHKHDQ